MPDESLRGPADEWRVVVDYPFDEKGRTPKDDLARLERFRQDHDAARTLVWIPAFLSTEAQRELGTLVILEHILSGERFNTYSTHLPPVERATARQLLENRQSHLRQRLRMFLEGAYGIQDPIPGSVDTTHGLSDHFQSLDPGVRPQPPVAATLREGFEHLLGQALTAQFPGHSLFPVSVKLANLRRIFPDLLRAAEAADGRALVEKPLRDLVRDIAEPLELGKMAETHFVLGQFWTQHFNRKRAQDGGPVTVRKLRAWIDEPKPRGLPEDVQNLVILVWAEQQQLAFMLHGGPVAASLDAMRDELELQAQKLPPHQTWQAAVRRAQDIFGIPSSELLNAANVAQLVGMLREKTQGVRANAHSLVERLAAVQRDFGLEPGQMRRGRTAKAVQALIEKIATAEPESVIDIVAAMPSDTSDPAMGRSVSQASALIGALSSTAWNLFEAVGRFDDERREAGQAIRARVTEALEADELAMPLAAALKAAQDDAVRLLAPAPPERPAPGVPVPAERWREIQSKSGLAAAKATTSLRDYLNTLKDHQRERVRVSWRVEDKD